MKVKFSTVNLMIVLMYLTFFFSTSYISFYKSFKYLAFVIVAIFLFSKLKWKTVWRKEFRAVNSVMLIYSAAVLLTSYLNRSQIVSRNTVMSAALFLVSIVEFVLMVQYMASTGKTSRMISIFSKMIFITVIINDAVIFLYPSLVRKFGGYLVGTKFNVVYFHLYLIVFSVMENKLSTSDKKWKRRLPILYVLLTILISVRVSCMTGLTGLVLFCAIYVIMLRSERLFERPMILIFVLVASCMFMYVYESVLSNSAIQSFVSEVLHRNINLTGRTTIYSMLPKILSERLMTGYGYGSSYEVCKRTMGFADTQNGLAEWVMQIGLPATVIMVFFTGLLVRAVKNCGKDVRKAVMPMFALLYVYSILASVEITFGSRFLLCASVLFAMASENLILKNESKKYYEMIKTKRKKEEF